MATHPWWARVLRFAAVGLAVLILLAVGFVQGQQWLLRWRAERLLADIRAIQMGKSTWADAQRLMNRWGAWGSWEGACTEQKCDYSVAIQDDLHAMPVMSFPSATMRENGRQIAPWVHRAYRFLGGHVASVYARIRVKDGVVWGKTFEVDIMTLPLIPRSTESYPVVVEAEAEGATNMGTFPDMRPEMPEISGYLASKNDCCRVAFVRFTPRTDALLVDSLLHVKLSCLTRWIECESTEELAPAMTRTVTQLQGERGKLVRPCNVDAFPLEILARDFHYAAIAAAIGPPKLKDHIIDKLRGAPSFRILQSLKNHADFDPPVLHDRQIPQMWLPRGADGEPHVVPPGTKVILLFDASPEETDRVYFGEAVVPLTAANLAAVQRGIARDALADRQ